MGARTGPCVVPLLSFRCDTVGKKEEYSRLGRSSRLNVPWHPNVYDLSICTRIKIIPSTFHFAMWL